MSVRRRLLIAAAAVLGAVGLAVLVGFLLADDSPDDPAGPRVVQPGAPGQPGRTLSPDELASLSPPAHNAADTLFMQRMIPHHAQALEMTALVEGRSQSADIPLLAERIEVSQRDEIAQMQRWLSDRRVPVPTPHASHPGHDALMPGTPVRSVDRARQPLPVLVPARPGARRWLLVRTRVGSC